MKIGKLSLATLLWMLGASAIAHSHPLAPTLLEISERSAGRWEIQWKEPLLRSARSDIAPSFPEDCHVAGHLDIRSQASGMLYRWTMQCTTESPIGQTIRVSGLGGTTANVLVRIRLADGHLVQTLLSSDVPEMIVPARATRPQVFVQYVTLGIEHLTTGWDHMLFILGLMLLIANVRTLVATITAFTFGHSISLFLAALGIVQVHTGWVEVAIACSILVLAAEAARTGAARRRASSGRWPIALVFGLLHGLGFAGALADIGLPGADIPLALFSFNVGIELGQLLLVAAIGLGFLALRWVRVPRSGLFRLAPAYAMGTLAAYWCFERAWPLI